MVTTVMNWATGFRPADRTAETDPLLRFVPKCQTWVATCLADVVAAWQLVYRVYVQTGLINPHDRKIHRPPQALQPGTTVFCTGCAPKIETTMTAIPDAALGLPLDTVYAAELDELRNQNRRLMEIGLFASIRQVQDRLGPVLHPQLPIGPPRGAGNHERRSTMELMRYLFYFGRQQKIDDLVIGVHPRHAPFYARFFGFFTCGPVRTYATVNDRPVVLLRGDFEAVLRREVLPPGLKYAIEHPVPASHFRSRYIMGSEGRLLEGPRAEPRRPLRAASHEAA